MAHSLLCFKCLKKFNKLNDFSGHFYSSHAEICAMNNKSTLYCRQGNFRQSFSSLKTLMRHITDEHIIESSENLSGNSAKEGNNDCKEVNVSKSDSPNLDLQIENTAVEPAAPASESKFDISTSAAEIVATLRTTASFSGTNINTVLNVVESLQSDIFHRVQDGFVKFLKSKIYQLPRTTKSFKKNTV